MAERKENNIRQIALLLLYAGFFLLLFYSCYYADFYETGLEGVRFWDILFEGKIHHFYSQVFLIGNMQYVPLYDFPMYIIFALWNFPLWVVEKCTGIDIYHSVLCLMWMKSMLLFWLLLFQKAFGGVIELVVDGSRNRLSEMRNRGEMLFLTSTFTVTGIAVLGQYDIITMTFMMLGLKAYLQGDKKWFTIWFALAAPLKYFSLLIYAPLVLMDEKRIRRILVQAFSVILPMVFFWIAVPYGRAELVPGCTFSGSSEGTNVAKPIYDALFVHGSVAFGTLFIYIFAEMAFLIFCYAYQRRKEDDRTRITIYLCLMAYVIQFTAAYSHPYWLILMSPFMILVILADPEKSYLNLMAETLMTAAMVGAQIMYFEWCFCSNIVELSFWKYLLPNGIGESGEWRSLSAFLSLRISDPRLQEYVTGACLSVYAAGLLFFVLWNCPFLSHKWSLVTRQERDYKWLYPVRAVISLGLGSIPLVLYVARAFGIW